MNIVSAPHMQGFGNQPVALIDPAPSMLHLWPQLGIFASFLILLVIFDLILRAVALWKSARSNQLAWFIALISLNTMGILPILYLVFFTKEPMFKTQEKPAKKVVKHKKG